MWSTGQLTKFADAMFQDVDGGPVHDSRPPRCRSSRCIATRSSTATSCRCSYAAYSPCFRKEAGAAGKDTRGLIRQHQFEKVELVWLTRAGALVRSPGDLDRRRRKPLQELGLPYRVMALCAGDIGFNAAKTYDFEVWLPGSASYREICSCSNCTDFQARRSQIRFRRDAKAQTRIGAYAQRLGPGHRAGRWSRFWRIISSATASCASRRCCCPLPDSTDRARRRLRADRPDEARRGGFFRAPQYSGGNLVRLHSTRRKPTA